MSYEASFQSYPQNESILSPPHYISRQLLLFCLQLAGTAEKLAACIYEYEPHLCAGTSLGSSVHYDPVMRASCTNAVAVHKQTGKMRNALLRISVAPLSAFSSPIPCKTLSTSRAAPIYKCELSEVTPLVFIHIVNTVVQVTVPPISFPAMCWSRVTEFSSETALVDGATGSQLTFTEARSLSRAFGSSLLRLGACKGDVMAIIMPNSPDYVVTFMGASEAGLVVTTLNPIYTPHEIRGQLTNSEAKIVVTTPLLLPKVQIFEEFLYRVKLYIDYFINRSRKLWENLTLW